MVLRTAWFLNLLQVYDEVVYVEIMPGYGAVCGGEVQLGLGWNRLSSPGYPREFKEGSSCEEETCEEETHFNKHSPMTIYRSLQTI